MGGIEAMDSTNDTLLIDENAMDSKITGENKESQAVQEVAAEPPAAPPPSLDDSNLCKHWTNPARYSNGLNFC